MLLMLRAVNLALILLVLPVPLARADEPPNLGANAALKYWQAYASLPRLPEEEGQRIVAQYLSMPLDEHARATVKKADYALQMMRLGAAQPHCDWGIAYEEGIGVRLPQGPAARLLASLACLRARLRFEEGQNTAAVEDLLAALTMGRHMSQRTINILLLVGFSIEHRVIETLALHLPRLNARRLEDLKARLAALPRGGTVAEALRYEDLFAMKWFIRQVNEAKDTDSLVDRLLFVAVEPEGKVRDPRARARAFVAECGGTAAGVLKYAEETEACYARMAKALELPLEQFEKKWQVEVKKQAGNPVFKFFFPAIEKMRWQQARIEVRRAQLAAAIAVQQNGRKALKDHPDPVAGGPFAYEAFEGGFELRSTWKLDPQLQAKWGAVQPLVLTVGQK
jgi:hypothetical protein